MTDPVADRREVIVAAIASYQGLAGLGPDWVDDGEEPGMIADLVMAALAAHDDPTAERPTCDDCGEYEQDCGCGGVAVRARLVKARALLRGEHAWRVSLLHDEATCEVCAFLAAAGDPT